MSLTRGGVALIGLILFVLLLSTPDNATVFIVLSCFAGLLILNVPYAHFAVRGVTVNREHASHVKEGSDVRVTLRVANMMRSARILLRFVDKVPGQGKVTPIQIPLLAGHGVETVSYICRAGKRGVYEFAACGVESSSPFGLVNARRNVAAKSELVVYPLYFELMGAMFPFRKSFTGFTAAPGSRPGEGASFFGLREYREGDPIRKIHWPSSLRAREIMVKEFEEDLHSSIVLLLDTYRPLVLPWGDSNLETAVRVVASLAHYTLVNGHPTTLMYFDQSAKCLRTDKAAGDSTPILDSLARLGVSSTEPAELISLAGTSIPRHSNLITVLLSANHDAMMEILRIRSQGVEVMLIIVEGHDKSARIDSRTAEMFEMIEAAGINTIVIRPGDDIQDVLSRNMRPMRRVRL